MNYLNNYKKILNIDHIINNFSNLYQNKKNKF